MHKSIKLLSSLILLAGPLFSQGSTNAVFEISSDTRLVLPVGQGEQWDAGTIYGPSIVVQGDTWHMLYAGNRVVDSKDYTRNMGLGYAKSTDQGRSWTKQGQGPLLQHPTLKRATVASWSCIDELWIMLYTFPQPDFYSTGEVYLARSTSGPEGPWEGPEDPVIRVPKNAWFNALMPLDLYRVGIEYRLYFYGRSDREGSHGYGITSSKDLEHWEFYDDPETSAAPYQHSDPILSAGPGDDWDCVAITSASVLRDGNAWELFYVGYDRPVARRGKDLEPLAYGRASSLDGIHWVKDEGGPILPTNQTIWPLTEVLRSGANYLFVHDTDGGKSGLSSFSARRIE